MSTVEEKALHDLTALVLEVLVKRSSADTSKSIPFIEVFTEACIRQKSTKKVFVQITPKTRDQIREQLVKSKYIIDDSEDVEAVFVTQMAIDKILLLV